MYGVQALVYGAMACVVCVGTVLWRWCTVCRRWVGTVYGAMALGVRVYVVL